MIINDYKSYYDAKEIREILGWNFAEYEKRRRQSSRLPALQDSRRTQQKIFPKKEFWRWAAWKEAALQIIPEEMPDVYNTERYLHIRNLLDNKEEKRRI